MPTRPCDYGLAMQDGSVFSDWSVDEDGCLYLVRISYDGYGCCTPVSAVGRIARNKSKRIIDQIEEGELEVEFVASVLEEYFQQNAEALWDDALAKHGLIGNGRKRWQRI